MTLPDAYSDDPEPEAESPQPEVSKRSRGVALGLCIFGGFFGLHRFYADKAGSAVAMMLTFGGFGVWWLYDLVLLAAGEFRDAKDLPIRNWGVQESQFPGRELGQRAERRVHELEEQVDGLREQFNDLAERVDFAERMLAKTRNQSPQLPPPSS